MYKRDANILMEQLQEGYKAVDGTADKEWEWIWVEGQVKQGY